MERETKELVTPVDGHKVLIKTYLNVMEYRNIEDVFLSCITINESGVAEQKADGLVVRRAEDELIKQSIVSVDGKTDCVLDSLLAMKRPDFDFVLENLNSIKEEKTDAKKGQ